MTDCQFLPCCLHSFESDNVSVRIRLITGRPSLFPAFFYPHPRQCALRSHLPGYSGRRYGLTTFRNSYTGITQICSVRLRSNIHVWSRYKTITCPLNFLVRACQPVRPALLTTLQTFAYADHIIHLSPHPAQAARRVSVSRFPPRLFPAFGTLSERLHTRTDAPHTHS